MTEGQTALLNRLRRSPVPVVYGRNGWRPVASLPKPAMKADIDTLETNGLARIDHVAGNLVAVEKQ